MLSKCIILSCMWWVGKWVYERVYNTSYMHVCVARGKEGGRKRERESEWVKILGYVFHLALSYPRFYFQQQFASHFSLSPLFHSFRCNRLLSHAMFLLSRPNLSIQQFVLHPVPHVAFVAVLLTLMTFCLLLCACVCVCIILHFTSFRSPFF